MCDNVRKFLYIKIKKTILKYNISSKIIVENSIINSIHLNQWQSGKSIEICKVLTQDFFLAFFIDQLIAIAIETI